MHCQSLKDSEEWLNKGSTQDLQAYQPETAECTVRRVVPEPFPIEGFRSFHSLFTVLCNCPSRYLFAIGLGVIFSFRRNSPPTLHYTLKQCDSANQQHVEFISWLTGLSPSMALCSNKFSQENPPDVDSKNYNSARHK
jgi:hypothetical protein